MASNNSLQHFSFLVNDARYDVLAPPLMSLGEVLREKCGLRGLKHGCQQGGCGACSVQVDGKLVLACLMPVAHVDDKSIETIEGLAQGDQLHPIQEAFVESYATQCGFCTAGMIMAAKALLEENPSPTREEVLAALSGNICRCTGYQFIVDAVLSAATKARSTKQAVMNNRLDKLLPVQDLRFNGDVDHRNLKEIGTSTPRRDAISHVTGRTVYFEDNSFPGMLHLKMVRSTHHHARIGRIDFSEAEKIPGFVRAVTHRDVPNNYYTILRLIGVEPNDEPVLADDRVVYWGEPIAAILAESPQAAAAAAKRVKVDYEPLAAVFDVEEALKPGAPVVTRQGFNYFRYEGHHCRRVRFGDVAQGFANADLIIERRWDTSPIEHAPLETTGCIAKPDGDGRFTVYTNTQALYFSLDNTALILGIPASRLHFVGGTVGGGFGGKVDVMVEPIATLAAMLTNRPVKFAYTREEEMRISSTRAAERFYIKDGVMLDGRIIARQITLYVDSGAYSRHSPYGTTKAAAHMPGPYTIPNVWVDAHCVYTNRQPSSAMRGFGVTLGDFAIESQMDVVAHELGVDPPRLRLINAYRDGEMKAHRKRVEGAALVEVIQKAAELAGQKLDPDLMAMNSAAR